MELPEEILVNEKQFLFNVFKLCTLRQCIHVSISVSLSLNLDTLSTLFTELWGVGGIFNYRPCILLAKGQSTIFERIPKKFGIVKVIIF